MKINTLQPFGNNSNVNLAGFNKKKITAAEFNRGLTDDIFVSSGKNKDVNPVLMKKLENPNTFKKLYSPDIKKDEESLELAKMFEDQAFLKTVMSNPKIMKASIKALYEISEDELLKAYNSGAPEEELEQLALTAAVLAVGLDSFKTIPVQEKVKQERPVYYNGTPQVAFGHIFNYGIFKKPATAHEKAETIVNKYATAAALTSGALAQADIIEPALLTVETVKMCKDIFKVYNRKGKYASGLIAKETGKYIGRFLAQVVLGKFPGAGNAANATITYALHQFTGRACMKYCEEAPVTMDEKVKSAEEKARFIRKIQNTYDTILLESDILNALINKVIG